VPRPNIVWIFPDQWRHDAFGFAGNDVIETPNVDELARRGAVFRGAHCESPVCQPSRASLLTGTYPARHGLYDNQSRRGAGRWPPVETPNFLRALQAAGYWTAEIGKMHFGWNRFGRLEPFGFDETREEIDKYVLGLLDTPYTRYLGGKGLLERFARHNASLLPGVVERVRAVYPDLGEVPGGDGSGSKTASPRPVAEPDAVPPKDYLDTFIGRSACQFIRDYRRDRPFFLWVTPIGPHPPLDAHAAYTGRYDGASFPFGPLDPDEPPDNRWGAYLRSCSRSGNEAELRLAARYYYGNCTLIDDTVVGPILRTLAETGRDRDTWVLFSSDHGELLGDHGFTNKRLFHRGAVQVPQIVVPPAGRELGLVVDGLTQGFDIVGTILDLAGAELPRASSRSLLPALEGRTVAREAVFSEIAGFLMVATPTSKLILHEESREPGALYDLVDDPDERHNLVGDASAGAILRELLERVEEFLGSNVS
jgi:arylsulfatase A-like enzyme